MDLGYFKFFLDTAEPIIESPKILFNAHGGYLLNTMFLSNGFDYITFDNGVPRMTLASQDAIKQ